MFFFKRSSVALASVGMLLAPLSPVMAQEVNTSVSDVEACRAAVLEEYQEDLRAATDTVRETMLQQWERQIGFRIRAATATRKAMVERALRASGRRQEQALGTALQSFVRTSFADTEQLAGLLNNDDPSPAFERWADRAMPSVEGIRRPLNTMETSLRLYANTRDRSVIRTVWQESTRKALNELKEEYTVARGIVAHEFMACEVDPAREGDDEEMSSTEDESVSSDGADSAGESTSDASSRSAKPVAGSAASEASALPVMMVTRARVLVVTEAVVPATLCTATVLSRVELEGAPGARVTGRFLFDDETLSEQRTTVLDSSGKGMAEFRRQISGAATARALTGKVRFIAEAANIVESNRVAYSHECPVTRDTASASGAKNDVVAGSAAMAKEADAASASPAGSSRVTIALKLEGSEVVRACGPHTFRLSGNVLGTNATKFKYRWEFSDGVMSDERIGEILAAGSSVQYDWTLSATGSSWVRLRVLEPVNTVSESVKFTLEQSCAAGAAAASAADGAAAIKGTEVPAAAAGTSPAGASATAGGASAASR